MKKLAIFVLPLLICASFLVSPVSAQLEVTPTFTVIPLEVTPTFTVIPFEVSPTLALDSTAVALTAETSLTSVATQSVRIVTPNQDFLFIFVLTVLISVIIIAAIVIIIERWLRQIRNKSTKAQTFLDNNPYRTPKITTDDDIVSGKPSSSKAEPASKLDRIVAEKKERLLSIPNVSFHYANKSQIESFYNDYFKESTIVNLVSEFSGELTSQVKGSVPQLVEGKLGSKDLSKWISTVKIPDISLSGMFVRYQRETIKSAQVTLGLEEIDIELNELQAFDDIMKQIEQRFSFSINDDLLMQKRLQLKEKAAERTLNKLEQANGWVLIEGKFKIEKKEDFYWLTYFHPVNEFLASQNTQITISVSIPVDSIETQFAGNYDQSIGSLIPIRIYGQIWQPIDRNANTWTLRLTPMVIY